MSCRVVCLRSASDCISHVRHRPAHRGTLRVRPCLCMYACQRVRTQCVRTRSMTLNGGRCAKRGVFFFFAFVHSMRRVYRCGVGQTLSHKLKGLKVEFRWVNHQLRLWFCGCVLLLSGAGVANDPSGYSVPCSRPTRH